MPFKLAYIKSHEFSYILKNRDKVAGISQTTISNTFSWMKMCDIRLRFPCSLLLIFELTVIPALVQTIAWCRPGTKPLYESMMINLLTLKCFTWTQSMKLMVCSALNGSIWPSIYLNGEVFMITALLINGRWMQFATSPAMTSAPGRLCCFCVALNRESPIFVSRALPSQISDDTGDNRGLDGGHQYGEVIARLFDKAMQISFCDSHNHKIVDIQNRLS